MKVNAFFANQTRWWPLLAAPHVHFPGLVCGRGLPTRLWSVFCVMAPTSNLGLLPNRFTHFYKYKHILSMTTEKST